jgi:hypothetical protein
LHLIIKFSSYPSPFADTSSISSARDFGILIFDSGGMQISSSFRLLGFGINDKSNSRGGGMSFNSIIICSSRCDDDVVAAAAVDDEDDDDGMMAFNCCWSGTCDDDDDALEA